MDYFVICLVALIGSGLTLFSGFGLGTILLPVFGLFFPIEIAIILTSIVHFLNNILKLFLFGRKANVTTVLAFGIPALLFAYIGATILKNLTTTEPLFDFTIASHTFTIMPIKLIVGVLLIVFALLDIIPKYKNIAFDKKYLPIGGVLSGFFGGLSGHQGALRSAFLIRTNLSKEAFIATGVVIACMIDASRLSVYLSQIVKQNNTLDYKLILFATGAAFTGVYFGNKLVKKVTIKTIQNVVAVMLLVYAVLLILGVL
ncbi:MAG: sulfite exporter TauE/SafE family protein [Bacteroidota bacterium]